MPRIEGFYGPFSRLEYPLLDPGDTINFIPQSNKAPAGKSPGAFIQTPGLDDFAATDADGYGRGIFFQDGRCFCVIGQHFFELVDNNDDTGTLTSYGVVVDDGTPASMCSNGSAGNQIMITSGGFGYIFDLIGNTLTQIADADFPGNVGQCLFVDGYFAVMKRSSRSWYISALEDGTDWDPLDVAERSIASDNIVSFVRLERTICLLGSHTSEFWYDTGDADFPFAPVQGAFMELGSAAAYAACTFGDTGSTLCWLGANAQGQGTVHVMNGFNPQKVSTYAVDLYVQYTSITQTPFDDDLTGAIAFGQQDRGHQFYWLYLPLQSRYTLVFDLTEQLWHQRAEWNTTTVQFEPHAAIAGAQAFGRYLVMSRVNSVVYHLDPATYQDNLLV